MSAPEYQRHERHIDPQHFRHVLGRYPTGVVVISGIGRESHPVAMVVGSFTSVSLHPPLVGFFPAHDSSSWGKLRSAEHFCVNILSAHQQEVCTRLASKDPDKFLGTAHRLSRLGNPILDDVIAWIDCTVHSITSAGDHELVLGRVVELDVVSEVAPLLFWQGRYETFNTVGPG